MKTGKICAKHPELLGERGPNGRCMACKAAYARATYQARTSEILAQTRRYKTDNRDKVRESKRRYYEANKQTVLERGRQHKAANKSAERERSRRYYEANKSARYAATARRKARKLQATPAWANEFFIQEAYALAKLREKVCGGKWHVDHIVPLRSKLVCGLHVEHNLRVIPAVENLRKQNHYWPHMPEVASGMDLA